MERKFAGAGISTMKAHEGVRMLVIEFTFNRLFVHILWYGIIDVKQGNSILADAGSDELT